MNKLRHQYCNWWCLETEVNDDLRDVLSDFSVFKKYNALLNNEIKSSSHDKFLSARSRCLSVFRKSICHRKVFFRQNREWPCYGNKVRTRLKMRPYYKSKTNRGPVGPKMVHGSNIIPQIKTKIGQSFILLHRSHSL